MEKLKHMKLEVGSEETIPQELLTVLINEYRQSIIYKYDCEELAEEREGKSLIT